MTLRSLCAMAVTLVALIGAEASAQGDPLQERLDKAVAVYNESVEKETKSLAEYIQGKLATAQGRGDLDLKKSIEAAEASLQRGEMPTLQLLKGAVEQAKRDLTRAKNKLLSEYRDVERDYVRQGNDKRAEAVRRESQQLDGQLAEHAIIRTPRPRPKPVIPADATKWPKTGHHYKFYAMPGSISWSEAQQQCREVGGYLACGETPEEFEFLYSLRVGKRSWLGGREVDGRWVWTTGVASPVPAGKGGDNKFLATTRGDTGGRIAQPDVAGFVEGYLCEWDE
ncbi:MAG: hypothetical protein K8S94_09195 [Planctomycetia bacterium]|nr:hypothetical protein [Planctomycetia bacterium]